LVFGKRCGYACLDVGKGVSDVMHQDLSIRRTKHENRYHVQFSGEEGSSAVLGLGSIGRVTVEELPFVGKGFFDCFTRVDIPLTTIDYWDVSQTKGDDPASQDVNDISALVHQVDFR